MLFKLWEAGRWFNSFLETTPRELQIAHKEKSRVMPYCKTFFINECKGVQYLSFILVDSVNNVENLTLEMIDALLLQKEKFWVGTLVTQHKGLNSTHDWDRNNRSEREK